MVSFRSASTTDTACPPLTSRTASILNSSVYLARFLVLIRLPTQRASQIQELLPHRWQAQIQAV